MTTRSVLIGVAIAALIGAFVATNEGNSTLFWPFFISISLLGLGGQFVVDRFWKLMKS